MTSPQPTPTHNQTSQETKDLVDTGYKYYVPNYKPRHMIVDHGKGAMLWDRDGNAYVDLGTGIAVNSLGHQNEALVNALTEQAKKLWHTSNIFFTEPAVKLAEELVESSGFARRVFFCSTGGEANEAAIKLVRKWAAGKGKAPEEREIITFKGSFHGRTLATVTATAQPKYQEGFEPLPGGFTYCETFNDEAAIEALVSDKTAAIMLEPVQGEGGIMPTRPGFLKFLRDLCDKHDALLVLDEVQCGMGRTGKLWGYMHEAGVKPDILTSAKALGCGFPIGAMLTGEKVSEVLQFGSHGSTFGGNPMACAVAREALKQIRSPELMANVEARGQQLRDGLEAINAKHAVFDEVRGRGLMIGAVLKEKWHGKAGDFMETGRLQNVLILQAGPNVLRFLPPLNITEAELAEGLRRVEAAVAVHACTN